MKYNCSLLPFKSLNATLFSVVFIELLETITPSSLNHRFISSLFGITADIKIFCISFGKICLTVDNSSSKLVPRLGSSKRCASSNIQSPISPIKL